MELEADIVPQHNVQTVSLQGEGGQVSLARSHRLSFPFPTNPGSNRGAMDNVLPPNGVSLPSRNSSVSNDGQSDVSFAPNSNVAPTATKPRRKARAGGHLKVTKQDPHSPGNPSSRKAGRGGQREVTKHQNPSAPTIPDDGHSDSTQQRADSIIETGGGATPIINTPSGVNCAASQSLRALYGRRKQWLNAKNRLINQGRAICRSYCEGDKDKAAKLFSLIMKGERDHPDLSIVLAPVLRAIEMFAAEIEPTEKVIAKTAKTHPLWPVVESISGFGPVFFAGVIHGAGNADIGDYRTHKNLHRRFGIGCNPDGTRQRLVAGEGAIAQAYSPERRSLVYNIAQGVLKAQLRAPKDEAGKRIAGETATAIGPLGQLYLDTRAKEEAREDEGKPKSKAHAHNRAARMVGKAVLTALHKAAHDPS